MQRISSTEFGLNSNGYVFSDELFIFHITEYCVIPEELIIDNVLEVSCFRKSSRYINSSCHIKFVLFTVYQSIYLLKSVKITKSFIFKNPHKIQKIISAW